MRRFFLIAACAGILLTGCAKGEEPSPDATPEAPAVQDEQPVTRNVSFSGTVEELGITIFQQGTHRLTMDGSGFILLESTDAGLDLDRYLGKEVEVFGSVQPTVEAGGTIMRVEQVILLEGEDSSDVAGKESCGGFAGFSCPAGFTCIDDPSDDCDPQAGGADCMGICEKEIMVDGAGSSSEESSSSVAEDSSSSGGSEASPTAAAPLPTNVPSASEEEIVVMADQVYTDASEWTQEYCSSHIGFCVPAHRNWYYKSFGTTTSHLWHVEFAFSSIEALGEGTIFLNLAPGISAAAGGTSGATATTGSMIVGYLDWEGDKHFEVVSDARLADAVTYILGNIKASLDTEG